MSVPQCDICRKFPASVIRQHAFDRKVPTQLFCGHCDRDPALLASCYIDKYVIPRADTVLARCSHCGLPLGGDFYFEYGKAYCIPCKK
jgi:ribosomal protein L34E